MVDTRSQHREAPTTRRTGPVSCVVLVVACSAVNRPLCPFGCRTTTLKRRTTVSLSAKRVTSNDPRCPARLTTERMFVILGGQGKVNR